jgi:hypothetical protein
MKGDLSSIAMKAIKNPIYKVFIDVGLKELEHYEYEIL